MKITGFDTFKKRMAWAYDGAKSRYRSHQFHQLLNQSLPASNSNGTILFWVPGGMPRMLHVEGAIAAALMLRGVKVHAVICDGAYHACIIREVIDNIPIADWSKSCHDCSNQCSKMLKYFGIPFSYIGDFISQEDLARLWAKTKSTDWEGLRNLNYDDLEIDRNIRSSIVRYLRGNSLTGHEEIISEYAFSGAVTAAAAASAFDKFSPSRIFTSQGVYVDWGPAIQVALSRNIPVSGWFSSYLLAKFYFGHVLDKYRTSFQESSRAFWDLWGKIPLSPIEESRLNNYFDLRYKKLISFDLKQKKKYYGKNEPFREKYSLNPEKPIWGVMAHLNWDAVSDQTPMLYKSFDEWILDTINEITRITNAQWLIKIHPAEAWQNPESGIQRLIEGSFPSLPSHIKLVPVEEEISPLDFFHLIDGGVTVLGTPGLELALQGKPVILAGEAHYGGKGFTYDGVDINGYKRLLNQAANLKPLTEKQLEYARRYAYCYFIQKQIPLSVVYKPGAQSWEYQHDKRQLLLPGRDPFVDFICEKIIDGNDFIMDEDLINKSLEYSRS